MAKGGQHDPTAQLTWIPAAGAWGDYAQASVGRKSEIITGNAIGGRSLARSVEKKFCRLMGQEYWTNPALPMNGRWCESNDEDALATPAARSPYTEPVFRLPDVFVRVCRN